MLSATEVYRRESEEYMRRCSWRMHGSCWTGGSKAHHLPPELIETILSPYLLLVCGIHPGYCVWGTVRQRRSLVVFHYLFRTGKLGVLCCYLHRPKICVLMPYSGSGERFLREKWAVQGSQFHKTGYTFDHCSHCGACRPLFSAPQEGSVR